MKGRHAAHRSQAIAWRARPVRRYKIENGRYVRKYVGSFVGFAPASDPRVIIAVMIDEPTVGHYGGSAAAPVFSSVAADVLRAMNISPDAQVDDLLSADKVARADR